MTAISCGVSKSVHTGDFKSLYRTDEVNFEPLFKLHHLGQNNYKLFFQFSSDELLYMQDLDSDDRFADLEVSASLFTGYGLGSKLDSVKTSVRDKRIGTRKRFIAGTLNIPFKMRHQNTLQCTSLDVNRTKKNVQYLAIDSTISAPENYMVRRVIDGLPILTEYLSVDTRLELSSSYFRSNELDVSYYNTKLDLPPPPFSLKRPKKFDLEPNEKAKVSKNNKGRYEVEMKGYDIARVKDHVHGGDHSLLSFYNGFPKISTYDQMIEAIRYITTKEEYSKLISSEDKKAALDEFWLERSGSTQRAKKIIRTYYSRAEAANRYFSAHTEGWKTDRGLIFVIFGRPISISKSMDSEIWYYGEEGKFRSLNFRFVRTQNPFSSNDFRLMRREDYKPVWYYFVDAWRGGRILN
ncbi:MAG: GWxTD domain-containing protein [Flavobacteriales bacterium]|nr:GWxTD domain-containing protein [Flavobacteriales bacterium]